MRTMAGWTLALMTSFTDEIRAIEYGGGDGGVAGRVRAASISNLFIWHTEATIMTNGRKVHLIHISP